MPGISSIIPFISEYKRGRFLTTGGTIPVRVGPANTRGAHRPIVNLLGSSEPRPTQVDYGGYPYFRWEDGTMFFGVGIGHH